VRTDEERERDTRLRESLESVDWGDVSARLTAAALRMLGRGGTLDDAKDFAQQAIVQLLDPDYKDWNPDERSLFEHLTWTTFGLITNRRRKRSEYLTDALDHAVAKRESPDLRSLERDITYREIHDKVFDGLRERFADKALETALVELFAEGINLPREQVRELGQPYGTLYRARQRVLDEARSILSALEISYVEH
jgi:hypothetical protein